MTNIPFEASAHTSRLAAASASPGVDLAGQAGAQHAASVRHEQRRRHALVGHVGDDDPQPGSVAAEEVVEVAPIPRAPDAMRRRTPSREGLRRLARDQVGLHLAGHLQFALEPPSVDGDGVQPGVLDGDRGAGGDPGEQLQVLRRKDAGLQAVVDVDDADRRTLELQRDAQDRTQSEDPNAGSDRRARSRSERRW